MKYEHVVCDNLSAVRTIFRLIGAEFDSSTEQAVITAFSRDSQRGSEVSRDVMMRSQCDVIDENGVGEISRVLRHYGLDDVTEVYNLEGTVTSIAK